MNGQFYERAENVAARGSSGPERSKWRNAGEDPYLIDRPNQAESTAPTGFPCPETVTFVTGQLIEWNQED